MTGPPSQILAWTENSCGNRPHDCAGHMETHSINFNFFPSLIEEGDLVAREASESTRGFA